MKRIIILVAILFLITTSVYGTTDISNSSKQSVMQQMNLNPLAFIENQGQWDESVLFRANAGGATMWFTSDGVYYQFTRRIPTDETVFKAVFRRDDNGFPHNRFGHEQDSIESIMIKASFVGANLNPNMVGLQEMEYKCNYFIGNDPNEWHTDVPNYEYILYEDIYPGIDLKYYGNGKQMEYDFIVAPGVDASQIKIKYEGAKSISVNEAGELEVETDWNTVTEQAPYIYQETTDGQREVVGKYQLHENNTFGFEMTDGYDNSQPLIIDPTIEYSTYLGGSDFDHGYDIEVDNMENIYVVGGTFSIDFPVLNPFQKNPQGSWDVFVTKLKSTGSSLLYSTYIGGSRDEQGFDIAIDSYGNAHVTGMTQSINFPLENHYQTFQGDIDVFVTKFSSNGDSLIYSTYLGGNFHEIGTGITINKNNNAFIVGYTSSNNFPINNQYQTSNGIWDAFITKLSVDGDNLVYSTYLGGNKDDFGNGITVDKNDNAYVIGLTDSPDFPTENPYQTYQGDIDVFVTKLSSLGNSLIFSTYIGGDDLELANSITIDEKNNTYIAGTTRSDNFPVENNYQSNQDYNDVFVTKFYYTGDSLIYSTYLGGNGNDMESSMTIDKFGNAYITGLTTSSDFPTVNPYMNYQNKNDVFVTMLNPYGDGITYSTYLGGKEDDAGTGIIIDHDRNIYIVGNTYSSGFPVQNQYQRYNGNGDAFITKFSHKPISIRGDVNSNGNIELNDGLYLLSYLYKSDKLSISLTLADVNCDQKVDITDVIYLINYFLKNGPAPCDACP